MELIFQGWRREVRPHHHTLSPVEHRGRSFTAKETGSIAWHTGMSARAKITGVGLTGDFLVTFNFEKAELSSWLKAYANSEPEAALRLLAEMQAEALVALAKKQPAEHASLS